MISIFRIHLQCLDSRQDEVFTARYQLFFNEVWYEARHRQRWDVWYHGASDSEWNVWKPWIRLPEIIIHIQTTQSLRNLLTRWWLKFQKNPWHLIRPEPLGPCVKRRTAASWDTPRPSWSHLHQLRHQNHQLQWLLMQVFPHWKRGTGYNI